MGFRPSANLRSRTFIGLLVAQFLAAFNDQAIHASAMFFAFHQHLLNEKQTISLMPILFYAPWAIFCTLAGYLSDRYSKRSSLVFWKFAEVAICLLALVGFYLGDVHGLKLGPVLVLACVFLMGTHSAFFVPAKYGVMPEILEPQVLSRGNGALESLSFLAVILGTVCGGTLSSERFFRGRETWIGVVLLALAVVGAAASLFIEKMPAANPERRLPLNIFRPLGQSLRTLFSARPLALAVVGIAFFTFVVAYMRQVVYMFGEVQTPRWDEMDTSLVVGSTALGIGLGSPLAGWLSGRKVELGLVPLGGVGMTAAAVFAALSVHWVPGLVAAIIAMGFFTGFYLVPLYTTLQHRAPKTSKGDAVAVSNFINVTGAILASALFYVLVTAFQSLGFVRTIPFDPQGTPARLIRIDYEEGRLSGYALEGVPPPVAGERGLHIWGSPGLPPELPAEPFLVVEHVAKHRGRNHYYLRPADEPFAVHYDNSGLPAFLFDGAAVIAGSILLGLCAIMPDLPRRALWAAKNLTGVRVRAVGTHHVPLSGPAVLLTNCRTDADCQHLRSATDRLVAFIGPVAGRPEETGPAALSEAAKQALARSRLAAFTEVASESLPPMPAGVPVIPTYVGVPPKSPPASRPELRVSFGPPLAGPMDSAAVAEAIRDAAVAEEDYHAH